MTKKESTDHNKLENDIVLKNHHKPLGVATPLVFLNVKFRSLFPPRSENAKLEHIRQRLELKRGVIIDKTFFHEEVRRMRQQQATQVALKQNSVVSINSDNTVVEEQHGIDVLLNTLAEKGINESLNDTFWSNLDEYNMSGKLHHATGRSDDEHTRSQRNSIDNNIMTGAFIAVVVTVITALNLFGINIFKLLKNRLGNRTSEVDMKSWDISKLIIQANRIVSEAQDYKLKNISGSTIARKNNELIGVNNALEQKIENVIKRLKNADTKEISSKANFLLTMHKQAKNEDTKAILIKAIVSIDDLCLDIYKPKAEESLKELDNKIKAALNNAYKGDDPAITFNPIELDMDTGIREQVLNALELLGNSVYKDYRSGYEQAINDKLRDFDAKKHEIIEAITLTKDIQKKLLDLSKRHDEIDAYTENAVQRLSFTRVEVENIKISTKHVERDSVKFALLNEQVEEKSKLINAIDETTKIARAVAARLSPSNENKNQAPAGGGSPFGQGLFSRIRSQLSDDDHTDSEVPTENSNPLTEDALRAHEAKFIVQEEEEAFSVDDDMHSTSERSEGSAYMTHTHETATNMGNL